MVSNNKLERATWVVLLVALSATVFAGASFAGEACGPKGKVFYAAESAKAVDGQVVLSESEAVMLELLSTSQAAGEPVRSRTVDELGVPIAITVLPVEFTTFNGTTAFGSVTCTHQGCVDPDCLVEGCDPYQTRNGNWGCSGPGCIGDSSFCGTHTPKGCTKAVTIQLH